MGRTINNSKRLMIELAHAADPEALGPKLAQLAMDGNVPVKALAMLLHVSEPTIYRWFYSACKPNEIYEPNIKKMITILNKAKRAKDTPLEGSMAERIKLTGKLVSTHRTIPATPK